MKRFGKLVSIFLATALLLICCGCGSEEVISGENSSDQRLERISQDEYILYQNIFYNDYAKSFDGKSVKKYGVFAILYDAYNEVDRYYVWGYYDNTKCCDWQWEFNPQKGEKLPPVGSLITVQGTFSKDSRALDNYWIQSATVQTNTVYTGTAYDLNMYAMSDTLERVQIINVVNFPDYFKGKEFAAYGRIKTPDTLQDPYYDGSWEIGFTYEKSVPSKGTMVLMTGTVQNGALVTSTVQTIK